MRFMLLMMPEGYETAAPGAMPDAKAVEAMMQYNDTLQRGGVLLSLEGLHPPSAGARISFGPAGATVTEGPFAESKEPLGGFWIIKTNSKVEAIDWASRCPASPNEIIEVRQLQEFSEFPDNIRKEIEKFLELSNK